MKMHLIIVSLLIPALVLASQDKSMSIDSLFASKYGSKNIAASDSLERNVAEKKSEIGDYFYKVVWVSFVIISFLLIGLLLYKKYVYNGSPLINKSIKVLSRQNIAPKQSILIVNIEGKKYALGTTEHAINLITELGDAGNEEAVELSNPANGFGQILKKLTNR